MLLNYLEEPHRLEQIHNSVIVNHQIDFTNPKQRDQHFVEMLKIFPKVTNSYIGFRNGSEYGARRENDGSFTVWNTTVDKRTLDYYRYDDHWGRQDYLYSLSSYDIRQRPAYLKGLASKRPSWTEVYSSATGRGLVITAVHPVYSPDNELVGVLGSSLLLDWIDEFLQSLTVTKNSSIHLIDRNENVIASTGTSGHPLLSQAVQVLKDTDQPVSAIKDDLNLRFESNGQSFLLHAHPIQGSNNLEWISMILIPEQDLTYPMQDLLRQLLLITVLSCILGLVTGILSARYIINPIIRVNRVATKIADGDFSAKIDLNRHDEVGQLVHTVNEMSGKLAESQKTMLAAQETRIKAEKIFSIGTMAAGVSHELNQPLNSIKVISGGMLYLINRGEKLEAEEFADNIREISNQTDRITKIIKHLRSFIRREETRLVPCDINTAVAMALNVVGKQLADHAITVHKDLQANLPPVLAHPTGLEEIIVNLLVNAMQALDLVDQSDKLIHIRTYFSTNIVLEVSDNGPGIDPALKKTIFESFTSTKRHEENLGLGLAIVNTIVTSYAGSIRVGEENDPGATFIVNLPSAQYDSKGEST